MPKSPPRFLALLRGINVGGKNIIDKNDLRSCFEGMGFTNVRTYIQSGNILFRSEETRVSELAPRIEAGLTERFSYDAQAVVLSERKYRSAVNSAPPGWGTNADQKHNAIFTLRSTTPRKLLSELPSPKEDLECITTGPGIIFWSASTQKLTRTSLMKLASSPAYQKVTVRNHNTVNKLLQLFETI